MKTGGDFKKFGTVTIFGPGMIGASIARAIKEKSLAEKVVGCSRNEETLRSSMEKGYIDSYALDPAAACSGADLVVLATPVDVFLPLVKSIAGSLGPNVIVMDAGSVKGALVRDIEAALPEGVSFVPCHPIAGSEFSGPDASSPDLFEGEYCIITPTERTPADALERIAGLWEAIGSSVERLDPDYHDMVYALVSHFPHLVMFAMVNAVSDTDPSALKFTGAGFDDSTRIAKSDPSLWRSICMMNKDKLIECISTLVDGLGGLKEALETGNGEFLEAEFARARKARMEIRGGR